MRSKPLRYALVLMWSLSVLTALCSCKPGDSYSGRLKDETYNVSFIPPKGWKTFSGKTDNCVASIGAKRDDDMQIYLCVSARPQDFVTTKSGFVNLQQIRAYVEQELKGYDVRVSTSWMQHRMVFEVIYMRRVMDGQKVRSQFVSQSFVPRNELLITITSFALGDDDNQARKNFESQLDVLSRSASSLWLHTDGGDPDDTSANRGAKPK